MTTGRVLTSMLFLACMPACASLTEPASNSTVTPPPKPSAAVATAAPAPTPAPTPSAPAAETVTASHILVAYSGALRASKDIKRSKTEAKKRAESLLARAKKGEDFAKLADDNSDDPTAKRGHGSLGTFTRETMVKPFADAAFALKPGEVTPAPVETQFGFHVIKRTQ
jgi:parvulin-like peptidyl-prolyl isomerase